MIPLILAISIIMSSNFMLSGVEHEKHLITSGPGVCFSAIFQYLTIDFAQYK